MAKGTTFLGWMAGGTGIVLLYSAYKNESPFDVLQATLSATPTAARKIDTSTTSLGSTDSDPAPSYSSRAGSIAANNSREGQIAAHVIQPTLVPIPTQPNMLLDIGAMTSFMKVQAKYGKPIILTGAYRSHAAQVDAYNRAGPNGTFGTPGTSKHEVGLAVDLHAMNNLEDPRLIAAFESEGWYRRGKVLSNGKPEPWHWSYKVPG